MKNAVRMKAIPGYCLPSSRGSKCNAQESVERSTVFCVEDCMADCIAYKRLLKLNDWQSVWDVILKNSNVNTQMLTF